MRYEERVVNGRGIDDVPVSPALKVVRQGEEPEAEDAIEWAEVQRLLYEQMWWPILQLPKTSDDFFLNRQVQDGVDVSAFNTHDFQRRRPPFDRYRYALKMAQQERQHALWTLEMILDRIEDRGKYRVMKQVREGLIEPGSLEGDLWRAAVWQRRCVAAREKIRRIAEAKQRGS